MGQLPHLYRLAQTLGDEDAEGQSVFTAARRLCAAVLTWPRALTTPDTVLTPGLAARLLTDVLSVSSAELSALVCACHWPCASFTSFVRAALTSLMSAVIWLTAPACTLTCLSWFTEARRASALAHRAKPDGGADEDGEVAEAAAEGELAGEVVPDAHPGSSASPHTARASLRHAVPVTIPGFISRPGSRTTGGRASPVKDYLSPWYFRSTITGAVTTVAHDALAGVRAGAGYDPVEPAAQVGDDLIPVGLVQDLVAGGRVGADRHVDV